jgi:2-dehydro-3-deoxygalactonokinase
VDLIAVDWGTSRLRAYRVAAGAVVARATSEEGIAALTRPGAPAHAAVLEPLIAPWLADDPNLPVLLAGMVGSREGWLVAPYAACPAGPAEIAAALVPVAVAAGVTGRIVPGLSTAPRPGAADVMRGEETLALGAGVADGALCLPGTHSKWIVMEGGRIARFASFMTGEMYGLLRHHAMVGKPAQEPADEAGFALGLPAGLACDSAGGLLHLAFAARALVLTGGLAPRRLGPYLSGLVIGAEIAGARALFGADTVPTLVADAGQAALYRRALARDGVEPAVVSPETALIAGLARIAAAL